MTADLAAALLNRAANGAELLEILDRIADEAPAAPAPSEQEIQF